MKIGVTYPQTEFGSDPAAVRDYAQTVEELGYTHILAYDHVVGANPDRPEGWHGPYTHESAFLSPFLMFSYMAAVTEKVEFVAGVIILPQRETVLAAKQAATLDVLSGGRFRMGIGIGWNAVEYVALNQDFHTRGKRVEEQIALMRQLWTEPLVTFESEMHTIPDAGLNPLPVQRPIPIWFGARADAALKRAAQLGDGWLTNEPNAEATKPLLERMDQYLEEAGRSRAEFGIEPRLPYGDGNPDAWAAEIEAWRALDATHLTINTMNAGLEGPQAHLEAIRHFAETVGVS